MPNPYFQFKQFTVYHDRCAMKVGTDGVLLGTWVDVSNARKVLDIGTGTGLISLMMAQRNKVLSIDAIDIDADATEQAKGNIKNSPFHSQIDCLNISLQDFEKQTKEKYDAIVSNPPFFAQSLKSPHVARTLARHTDSLPLEELIGLSLLLLSDKGRLSLIYPYEYKETLLSLAVSSSLYVSRITNVYPTSDSSPKRILIELSKGELLLHENDLIIEKSRHVYSDDFMALAKDFYLKM